VGPRAGLDTEVRGKILLPLPGIEPRSPSRPVRSQTLYCATRLTCECTLFLITLQPSVRYQKMSLVMACVDVTKILSTF
jgi:hypothetical protein